MRRKDIAVAGNPSKTILKRDASQKLPAIFDSSGSIVPISHVLNGGRIATYGFVDAGELQSLRTESIINIIRDAKIRASAADNYDDSPDE